MTQPLQDAVELVEQARIIVERHVRSQTGAERTRAIQISEHLTSALVRLESLTADAEAGR